MQVITHHSALSDHIIGQSPPRSAQLCVWISVCISGSATSSAVYLPGLICGHYYCWHKSPFHLICPAQTYKTARCCGRITASECFLHGLSDTAITFDTCDIILWIFINTASLWKVFLTFISIKSGFIAFNIYLSGRLQPPALLLAILEANISKYPVAPVAHPLYVRATSCTGNAPTCFLTSSVNRSR